MFEIFEFFLPRTAYSNPHTHPTPPPRPTTNPCQLSFQFFSIQDILKYEHSLRTKNVLNETLAL